MMLVGCSYTLSTAKRRAAAVFSSIKPRIWEERGGGSGGARIFISRVTRFEPAEGEAKRGEGGREGGRVREGGQPSCRRSPRRPAKLVALAGCRRRAPPALRPGQGCLRRPW